MTLQLAFFHYSKIEFVHTSLSIVLPDSSYLEQNTKNLTLSDLALGEA